MTTVKSLGQSVMSLNSFSRNRRAPPQPRRDLKELPSPNFAPKSRFLANRANIEAKNNLNFEAALDLNEKFARDDFSLEEAAGN